MPPRKQDLTVFQGTNATFLLTFTDDDTDALEDLTGSTIHFRVKRDQSDLEPALIQKSSANPSEILILTQAGATLGQARIFIDPADTESLTAGRLSYDVWLVEASGDRHTAIPPSILELINTNTDL